MKNNKSDKLLKYLGNIDSNKITLLNLLKVFSYLLKIKKLENIEYLKVFIEIYFTLEKELPQDFYELLLKKITKNNYLDIFNILIERNIYSLISYLKYNQENTYYLKEIITPCEYYQVPKKLINKIIELLKQLNLKNNNPGLVNLVKDKTPWALKRNPTYQEFEYIIIAYKMYLSIGFNNTLELLTNKYGNVDYEIIFYLFNKLDTLEFDSNNKQIFIDFLFNNKKDISNTMKQVLNGELKELFLNFDYFYNNFNYFISKLGTKIPKNKLKKLLEERYVSKSLESPDLTADILEDMLFSYYHKYDYFDTSEEEIYKRNFDVYNEFLRKKYTSSIPMIDSIDKEPYICEIISLSDPRNLVLGYRAGNCFRINGEASILFKNFLKSPDMRLVSISTREYKDFAMMLIFRNGNVLIGQGIEVSKFAPDNIKGEKLYNVCREVLKELMEYMNFQGDSIVATIIGASNANVSSYNNQILPFLINPILENKNNFYNGIYNYQCLLDIYEGKSLSDIKLYKPDVKYLDKRDKILRRNHLDLNFSDSEFFEFEKRIVSLNYLRSQIEGNFKFFLNSYGHSEVYESCNKDWYIKVFDDLEIDSFLIEDDERARIEYENELTYIKEFIIPSLSKKKLKKI